MGQRHTLASFARSLTYYNYRTLGSVYSVYCIYSNKDYEMMKKKKNIGSGRFGSLAFAILIYFMRVRVFLSIASVILLDFRLSIRQTIYNLFNFYLYRVWCVSHLLRSNRFWIGCEKYKLTATNIITIITALTAPATMAFSSV